MRSSVSAEQRGLATPRRLGSPHYIAMRLALNQELQVTVDKMKMMRQLALLALASASVYGIAGPLETARDKEDRAALERAVGEYDNAAKQRPTDANAYYRLALAHSYAAEIASEVKDKGLAAREADAGIAAAGKAVSLNPNNAEYHRLLGTLYGQAISGGNMFTGMKYGKQALESLNKAIEMNPKAALNYVSRGIGYYYTPDMLGGGATVALKDFDQAIKLDPNLADAHLWRGIALRKLHRNAEAHEELAKSVQLNPQRIWAKQQLDKTPLK